MEVAARWGDAVNDHSSITDVASVDRFRERVETACETVGRDPSTLRLTAWTRVAPSPDGRLDADRSDTIAGTPQSIADRLAELHAAGIEHLTCFIGDEDDGHQYPALTAKALDRFAPILEALRACTAAAPTCSGGFRRCWARAGLVGTWSDSVDKGGSAMLKTIARTTDVAPGQVRAFEIGEHGAEAVNRTPIPLLKSVGVGRSKGTRITLANVAARSTPSTTRAPTRGCSLGDGKLDGSVVQCACHGSRFDVTSGAVVRGPAEEPVRSGTLSMSPTARSRSRSTCSRPCSPGS